MWTQSVFTNYSHVDGAWIFHFLPPSNTARKARIRKGALFPTNSYITLPNGAPTGTTNTFMNIFTEKCFVPHLAPLQTVVALT